MSATTDPDPAALHPRLLLCIFRNVYGELRTRYLVYAFIGRQHTGLRWYGSAAQPQAKGQNPHHL